MTISINSCSNSNPAAKPSVSHAPRKTVHPKVKTVERSRKPDTAKHGWCGATLLRGHGV
jgi:hypothetical protein